MKKTKIEALSEMKSRRGEATIILFHNGEFYEAYSQDAKTVSEIIEIPTTEIDELITVQIAESQIEEISNKLLDAGCAICIAEMRDSNGNFVVGVNQQIDYEEE